MSAALPVLVGGVAAAVGVVDVAAVLTCPVDEGYIGVLPTELITKLLVVVTEHAEVPVFHVQKGLTLQVADVVKDEQTEEDSVTPHAVPLQVHKTEYPAHSAAVVAVAQEAADTLVPCAVTVVEKAAIRGLYW